GDGGEGAVGLLQRRAARGRERVALAPASAALRSRIGRPRPQEPLALEPVERGVDGVDRDVASRSRVDLPADGGAVRLVPQPQDAQQDELLEVAEDGVRFQPHCGEYPYGIGRT